jgi:hypothetical protein
MKPSRARTVIEGLLQKTVANGCTPGEAASATARAMLLTAQYLSPNNIRKPDVTKPKAPARAYPTEADYAARNTQFKFTSYPYRPQKPPRFSAEQRAGYNFLIPITFFICVAVMTALGIM